MRVSVQTDGDRPFLLPQTSDMNEGMDVSDGKPHGQSAHEESCERDQVFQYLLQTEGRGHDYTILPFSHTFLPTKGIKL